MAANFTYSYVVARSRNDVIGCENQLPWRLQSDLRRFKKITSGRPMIMGRKTYESIGRPLPNRPNIVITRDPTFCPQGVIVAHSKSQAKLVAEREARRLNVTEIMVIGGEAVFDMFRDELSKVYLTQVNAEVNGDAFFKLDFKCSGSSWRPIENSWVPKSDVDEFDTEYSVWEHAKNSEVSDCSWVPQRRYA